MAGEVASLLISRVAVPILYYAGNRKKHAPGHRTHRPLAGHDISRRMEDTIMSLEHTIRAIAGTFVLGSLALDGLSARTGFCSPPLSAPTCCNRRSPSGV